MDKSTQKRRYGVKLNREIMKALMTKYDVKQDFIRKSLKNERTSEKSLAIQEDYKKMEAKHKELMAQLQNV
jgi:hypothetical protein